MIYLQELAEKLNDVLNDSSNPLAPQYQFRVETTGYHLDFIYDRNTGKNFIPVFISALGGSINPVPILKQVNLNVPIVFYFPVRFKNDMFTLFDYLFDIFAGQILNYNSKPALSNLSVPTYGEIQNLDLTEFKKWVGNVYKETLEVMEPYISMQFTIYLQSANDEFTYGNAVKLKKVEIWSEIDGVKTKLLEETKPASIERIDMESSESAAQQLFSNTHAFGYPANAAFTKQLPLIIKNNSQYRALLEVCEKDKNPQSLIVKLTEEIPFVKLVTQDNVTTEVADPLEIETEYYVTNYSRKTTLGELLGIQLTLSIRGDLDDEEEVDE